MGASTLLREFPELSLLGGQTATKTDRATWINRIAGFTVSKDTALDLVDARRAALRILADVTGFGERHVYERLQQLHGGPLKKVLDQIRVEVAGNAGAASS